MELPVWYAINLSDPEEFAGKRQRAFLNLPEEAATENNSDLSWMVQAMAADRRFDWQKQLHTFHQAGGDFRRKKICPGRRVTCRKC